MYVCMYVCVYIYIYIFVATFVHICIYHKDFVPLVDLGDAAPRPVETLILHSHTEAETRVVVWILGRVRTYKT